MKVNTITKKVQLVTEHEIMKGAKPVSGHPIRKWKLSVYGLDENNERCNMEYVEKVEYILHPSFTNPKRMTSKPPYSLQEKGWGEFDMQVILHFVDKTTYPLEHDLNFRSTHYEVPHVVTFSNPKGALLKALGGGKDSEGEEVSTPEKSTAAKGKRSTTYKAKSSRKKPKPDSDMVVPSLSSISPEKDEKAELINCELLAEKLYKLSGSDIVDVVNFVKERKSKNTYVNEDVEGNTRSLTMLTDDHF
ncbi:yeats-domain-containing protein [Basidiobolus meristosporus CBS 931.73]|uniref:Yeats-domain-containing protein n=1 Tax=Basidiobolus meristosporus CBS 931.73 TaxID=1314790 RepID=A0A1Y1Z3Z3_9FUNG|nr:yeats-domain-containing protein [Basidiobolus meristosporus CBS 931.73]|eukprot:ORY04834.1 yeats-domain-containing protein [Basidiobolus meristosporus CBS 931.73]